MFLTPKSANTIWLVGDSHAESILLAADLLSKENNMNLFAHFYSRTAFPSTPYRLVNNKKILIASKQFRKVEERMLNLFVEGDLLIIGIRIPTILARIGMNTSRMSFFSLTTMGIT